MIIIDYILISAVCVVMFIIGWLTFFMMVNLFLENKFSYLHKMAEKAMEEKDFDAATRYHERLQRVAKLINRADDMLYFQFFG